MFKKTANTFLVKAIVAAINLCIVIMLSRWMGAQGKGEASLIVASIAMLMLFCNMIGGASLVYLVPRYNIFMLAVVSNLWSVLVCAASYFILTWSAIIPQAFVLHVCILSLINSFLSTNASILLGKEQIGKFNFIQLLQAIINIIILWVLLSAFDQNNTGSYITSLYVALLSCFVISTFLVLSFVKYSSVAGSQKLIRELARLGFTNQLAHITGFLSLRLSYFLLNKYCMATEVGVYSNGVSLIESLLLISNSISTVQYPTIANSEDKAFSQELTVRLTRLSILICIVVMIPLLLLPGNFFVWLFGNEFRGVRQVMLLLSPGILFYNIALITGHYFSGTGRYKINTIGNLAALIVTVALSSFFISSYSIKVAALITDAAYIMSTITLLYFFNRESKISITKLIPVFSDFTWAKEKIIGLLKR